MRALGVADVRALDVADVRVLDVADVRALDVEYWSSAILRNRGGYGKPTAHAHVIMFDALPVGRMACRVSR